MVDTNWDICFVCQVSTEDKVRSSTDGYKTFAKNIPEFHKKGKLGFHLERISNANSDLLLILTKNKAVCFSKYSDSKLKRFYEAS